MQPLPVRAGVDVLTALAQPAYHNLQLWVSCFEIYGGKVYDLLNARKRLEVREDGRKKVCIVGLKDFKISNVRSKLLISFSAQLVQYFWLIQIKQSYTRGLN